MSGLLTGRGTACFTMYLVLLTAAPNLQTAQDIPLGMCHSRSNMQDTDGRHCQAGETCRPAPVQLGLQVGQHERLQAGLDVHEEADAGGRALCRGVARARAAQQRG